jgi:hypothetical protein
MTTSAAAATDAARRMASASELRDRTATRDAQSVAIHEVHLTSIDDFVRELRKDAEAGVIRDGVVRYSIVDGRASEADVMRASRPGRLHVEQFEGRPTPYLRKFVEVAYIARDQLVKVSRYCGVALDPSYFDKLPGGRPLTEATALAIQEYSRAVLKVVDEYRDLDLRSGAVYVADGSAWSAAPDLEIAPVPVERCATCDELIYYKNEAWRHKATGRAEHLVDGRGTRGQARKVLHHLADPQEAGRMV